MQQDMVRGDVLNTALQDEQQEEEMQLAQLLERVMDTPLRPLRDAVARLDGQNGETIEHISKCASRVTVVANELGKLKELVSLTSEDAQDASRAQGKTLVNAITSAFTTLDGRCTTLQEGLQDATSQVATLAIAVTDLRGVQQDQAAKALARSDVLLAQLAVDREDRREQAQRADTEMAALRAAQLRLMWVSAGALLVAVGTLGVLLARAL